MIAAALRWAGAGLMAAGCVWTIFRRSGPRASGGRAGTWRWLWAVLAAYVTCSLSAGAVMLGAGIRPDPAAQISVSSILMLPAIPALGFAVACLILVSFVTTHFVTAIVGLVVLALMAALLVVSGWLTLRGARDGRWPTGPTAFFLLTLAGLSALSTVSFCGSLTA